jgi:hypothetical protein
MNYETHIFSQMHSIVTNAIATGTECRTFNQLADKLNEYGITNAKDKSFTGGTLQKYIHRKSSLQRWRDFVTCIYLNRRNRSLSTTL